jgi:hypothetical protein
LPPAPASIARCLLHDGRATGETRADVIAPFICRHQAEPILRYFVLRHARFVFQSLTAEENPMSKKAAEHHKKASEHLTHAARHHGEAAKHHDAGQHEKAAHHAHTARGHVVHATKHAEEAVMAHTDEHGKK